MSFFQIHIPEPHTLKPIKNRYADMDNIFRRFKAALIDMDGVLYDSMPGHTLAWKRMMEGLGVECTRDEFYLYEGMTGVDTINLLFQRSFGHGCTSEKARDLYAVKSRYFREMGPAKPMPGASKMLDALSQGGMRCVLVTGSGQKSLIDELNRDYPGIFGDGMRVTANDVSRGKPDPEPYLKGLSKAGVKSTEAMVIENALLGVRAGKAAGCFTVAVTTGPIPRSEFEREGADMIFDSMEAFADFVENQLDQDLMAKLKSLLNGIGSDKVFIITDKNVKKSVPVDWDDFNGVYEIEPGEKSKNIQEASRLWSWLSASGATRRSLVINIGGGVVSDLGGFVASTFKRGLRYINVPTSLLAMADASIGGKTGIDFNGLKNEIGTFELPAEILVCPAVLKTLPYEEMLSGFAEVMKMAMLNDIDLYRRLIEKNPFSDKSLMKDAVKHASECKREIVDRDPKERGRRKILNLGHTAGHAFESYSHRIDSPVSHGMAVAHGLHFALCLSNIQTGLTPGLADEYKVNVIDRYYGSLPFGPESSDEIIELMKSDKKNSRSSEITFILLEDIGKPVERTVSDFNLIKKIVEKIL